MYYCFIQEDINSLQEHDPLMIQIRYANRIEKSLFCNIGKGVVLDQNGKSVSLVNKRIMLRGTCENYAAALCIISKMGGKLFETKENIECIENWHKYISPARKIYSMNVENVIELSFSAEITNFLKSQTNIFIKTQKKGCSISLSTEQLINRDDNLYKIVINLPHDEELLLSQFYNIDTDSYGKKEARFFVFDNQIQNESRNLHSVKHKVSKKFREKAFDVVENISKIKDFPNNYVLDLGEFIGEECNFIDIIEINPITCSLCYNNNSIYDTMISEIETVFMKFGAGYEYCYDSLQNPHSYVYRKNVGDNFEYKNESHYCLL